MEDYVNVNFFWGGEIIRRDNDIRYSVDPKEMRYIQWGTSFEKLKEVVYGVMQISRLDWNVKMTYKYPNLGIGNVVAEYYIAHITSDDDVRRMLSIPRRMQMGMGDVSMYIEAEKIILEKPNSYDQPRFSQPTRSSCEVQYGNSQSPKYGTTGWSNYYYGGASNVEAYAGGSSSHASERTQQSSELSVGALFRDKDTLVAAVRHVHISSDRNYHVEKSNPTQFIARCVVPNCMWRLRAAKKNKHGLFEITKCPVPHTCMINEPLQDHKKISIKLISRLVKPHVMERPNLPITTVITLVNDVYNHQVGYNKAWRGKQLAIEEVYGNWTTTYAALPKFMTTMVHANPGSVVEIHAVPHQTLYNTSVCKRIFWCLKAMMDGWQHARPVISIDGTFLKGRYRGKLLIAMGVDSNNHQYPVCYGLVDEETYDNWSWFLQLLRKHVCKEREGVCIISDRAPSILAAMRDDRNGFTQPYGVHRYCLFHLRTNFSSHHPGEELKKLMWLAGVTPQVRKHDAYMKKISEISPPALQYLRDIAPELWTLCHDTGGARYGQTTTNLMEDLRMARFLPVTAMMEYMFYKIVKIVNTHRNNAEDSMQKGEDLCARTTAMLSKIQARATAHKVVTFSRQHGLFSVLTHRYEYKSVWKGGNMQNVNIRDRSCTCGKWTCHHLPCSHAVAGCMANNINWRQWIEPYHYTSKLQMLWEPLIYPLATTEYWNYDLPRRWEHYGTLIPDETLRKMKKKHGETGQSVRIRTEMDAPRTRKICGRCNQEGHTKRSKGCPRRSDMV